MDKQRVMATIKALIGDVLILAGLGMALWFVYQVWPVGTWLAGAVVAVILGFAIGGDR